MRGWLLDTNVVSEVRKPHADARVVAWVEAQAIDGLFLSSIVLAEIRYGIALLPIGSARRAELEPWVRGPLREWFEGRILEVTEDVILTWRRMVQSARNRGYTPPEPDCLLAATAVVNDLCLVTRNVADFHQVGIPVLNPWNPPA